MKLTSHCTGLGVYGENQALSGHGHCYLENLPASWIPESPQGGRNRKDGTVRISEESQSPYAVDLMESCYALNLKCFPEAYVLSTWSPAGRATLGGASRNLEK